MRRLYAPIRGHVMKKKTPAKTTAKAKPAKPAKGKK
jgi:hypothetical protein